MRDRLRRAFGCDLRSLAAFRIALGLLLLADICWRLPFFGVWLTEDGAWPIAAARAEAPRAWSLYFLSGSEAWTIALLALTAGAALALLVGWRTRLSTVACWVFIVSLQNRNTLPLNGGDLVLRLLLFWGAFLPLGACWSIDARRRSASAHGVYLSIGTAALLIQVVIIYIFNALYKTGPAWKDGSAVSLALQHQTYATSFGLALTSWPGLLQLATRATWWLELGAPLLVYVPLKSGILRGLVAFAFMSFHLALFATLRIGLFPLICVAAWLPFLPPGFWDALKLRAGDQTPPPEPRPVGWIVALVLAAVLALNVLQYAGVHRPAWLRVPMEALRLSQQWCLFAPDPSHSEGWMIAVIESSDGNQYDALAGREIDWARPEHLGTVLPTGQWRKFLAAVRNQRHPDRARRFAQYCARAWERAHPGQRALRARVHYLWEWVTRRQTPPDHWFIYEEPPGPLTETARKLGYPIPPPSEDIDL